MGGLTDILNTARDALAAQSYGLNVTSQNVSNLNTPEYVRREALLGTNVFGDRTYGSVQILGLRRAADQYVQERYLGATGMSSYAGARNQLLTTVEQVFNDPQGLGIGDSLAQLFSAFAAVASNPSDLASRGELLQKASFFAEQMNLTAATLEDYRVDLLDQATGITAQVNSETEKIAALSKKIQLAEQLGQDAADLRDQRDQRLRVLSELVDVRTFTNDQGELVIQGAGTTLVEGGIARRLSVDLAAGGNLRILASRTGTGGTDVTQFVNGGKLAAIMEVRDTDIVSTLATLDQLAFDLATEINTLHAGGVGLDGSTGNDFFSVSAVPGSARSLAVSSDVLGQPNRVAAAAAAGTTPGDGSVALALSRLRDATLASGGTQTASAAYAALVGDVASRKAEAQNTAITREAITAQTTALKESTSGVSLDEEMINLTKFQRAYEAASKVLSTADQLLAELINRLG